MKIIKYENFNILKPNMGYLLRRKEDSYKPKYINKNGIEIKEHKPFYFIKAYISKGTSLYEAEKMYCEEYDERSE